MLVKIYKNRDDQEYENSHLCRVDYTLDHYKWWLLEGRGGLSP